MWSNYMGMGMGGFGFFPLIGILFAGFIIYLLFSRTQKSSQSALDILNKRYAKGEINKDEYDKIKGDLNV